MCFSRHFAHRVVVHAPLHHKAGHDAKESVIVIETALHQLIEAVRAHRRPVAMHLHGEYAPGGGEFHPVLRGSGYADRRG